LLNQIRIRNYKASETKIKDKKAKIQTHPQPATFYPACLPLIFVVWGRGGSFLKNTFPFDFYGLLRYSLPSTRDKFTRSKAEGLRRILVNEKRKLVMILLEVIFLLVAIPMLYWGGVKLLLGPIADILYDRLPTTVVIFIVLFFDLFWVAVIIFWPKGKIHARILLTILVLTLSAVVITCFVVADALDGAF
jgi:hypothetical protein